MVHVIGENNSNICSAVHIVSGFEIHLHLEQRFLRKSTLPSNNVDLYQTSLSGAIWYGFTLMQYSEKSALETVFFCLTRLLEIVQFVLWLTFQTVFANTVHIFLGLDGAGYLTIVCCRAGRLGSQYYWYGSWCRFWDWETRNFHQNSHGRWSCSKRREVSLECQEYRGIC